MFLMSMISYAQTILQEKITFECTDLSFPEVLDSINAVAGVSFTYVNGVFPEKKTITLKTVDTPLKEVLSLLIKGTTIKYKVVNDQIVFSNNFKSKSVKYYAISGSIKSKNGSPLDATQVTVLETQESTLTDKHGFFSIQAPTGEIKLHIYRIGYKEVSKKIEVTQNVIFDIKLKHGNRLPMVVVTDDSPRDSLETIPPTVIRYNVKKLKQMPLVGGEADALQFIQLIPGIQAGNEGAGGIYVRGGGIDQNQIIMEGNTVYNPSHLFGFFSVFNSDAIRRIDLTKNAIPARYGERLSSVLDIKLKEPSTNQTSGSGSIGTMLSKVYFEVPIIKGNTALLFAGRKSMTEFGFMTYNYFKKEEESQLLNYGFFDYNVKLNHYNKDKSKFYINAFQARDWLKLNDIESLFSPVSVLPNSNDKLNWGNWSSAVGWSSNPNKKFTQNGSLNYITYQFKLNEALFINENPIINLEPETVETHKYSATLSDLNLKYDMDLLKGEDINYKLGVVASQKLFNPGMETVKIKTEGDPILDTIFNNKRIETNEISTFIESNIKLFNRVNLNLGLRNSWFNSRDASFLSFQPRLSMNVKIKERIGWDISFSYVSQFLHLLTNTGIGLPTDIWVPAIKGIPPQRNYQYATGVNFSLLKDINVSVEGFYKRQYNLIAYNLGSKFVIDSKNWENNVFIGEGWAYGGELLFEKNTDKFAGWLGYTLSWSQRRFDLINNGMIFPFKFDRRHDVSIVGLYEISNRIKLSLSWVFSSGNLTTIPTGIITVTNPDNNETSDVYIYENLNNFRMNSFHRLNLGLEFYKEKVNSQRIIKINLYNAYSRRNPFYVAVQKDESTNNISFKQISLFPIIPSISYECKF